MRYTFLFLILAVIAINEAFTSCPCRLGSQGTCCGQSTNGDGNGFDNHGLVIFNLS